jgi:hypothetical protein
MDLVAQLERDGVVSLPRIQLSPTSTEWWQSVLVAMRGGKKKGKAYKTGRIAYRVDTRSAPSTWLQDVFTKELKAVMREYLKCKSVAVHHCEIIAVPRQSPTQMFHRDHNYDTRICLTLAVCMKPDHVLKTEFVLGSHLQEVRAKAVAPLCSTALFEGCILHAGGEETDIKKTDYERLFFTLTDAKEADKYSEALNCEFPDQVSYEVLQLE